MKKYFLSLIGCMMLSLHVSSQDTTLSVDVSWYSDGNRSFVLTSAEQMLGLSELVAEGNTFSGKTILLNRDVDLSQTRWIPIGSPETPFSGMFDGGMSNVVLGEMQKGAFGGLFGYVAGGTVKNVSVAVVSEIRDIRNFGTIAWSADSKSTIEYCSHVQPLKIHDGSVVGGIVGSSEGYVNGCSNLGSIENLRQDSSTIGGIVGSGTGVIENCYNEANLYGSSICGGIIGATSPDNSSMTQLNLCYNEGDVSARSENENRAAQIYVGGIGGRLSHVEIMECYNAGRVTAYNYKDHSNTPDLLSCAGGLVGIGSGKFSASYNIGNVAARSVINVPKDEDGTVKNYAGGIIGYNTEQGISEMEFCYNAGSVFVFGQAPKGTFLNYGGLIADFESFMPKLTACYSVEGCCDKSAGALGFSVPILNSIETVIPAAVFKSSDFLKNIQATISLNSCDLYAYDENKQNGGFPVLQSVLTGIPMREEDGKFTLKGATRLAGKKYFQYWITGLEKFKVDVLADEDFEYNIGRLDSGEHHFKAYVRTTDGKTVSGELHEFTVRK